MAINKGFLASGVFSISNNLVNVLLRFLSFYFIIRSLTKDQFGVWALFLVVTSIIEVVRNGFIKNAIIKFIASSSVKDHEQIQTASLLLNVLITSISLVFILSISNILGHFWKAPEITPMFNWYVLTAFFLIFLSHIEFVAAASFKFKHIFVFNAARNFSFLGFVLFNYLSAHSQNLNVFVIYQGLSAGIGLLVAVLLLKSSILLGSSYSKFWIKKLFHFGKYVVGTNLSTMIFKNTDQLMLGAIMTTQSVAVYSTALRINNFIDAPVMGISNVFYTHSSNKGQSKFKDIYINSVGIIMSIIVPALVITFLFADIIILLIAGQDYVESAGILRITMLYSFFIPFARQFGTLLDSIGKPHINLRLTIISSIINIFFSYLGIIKFGVIGAAYGTLLTYITSFIIIQIYLNINYKISVVDIFKSSVKNYFWVLKKIIHKLS